MNDFCQSCGMPLEENSRRGDYCVHCTDEKGNLYPRAVVEKGVTEFLSSWAPKKDGADFPARAKSYLDAMPAWAPK